MAKALNLQTLVYFLLWKAKANRNPTDTAENL